MLNQTARGMVALGTAGIIHRDLAARNVLVDEKLRVKIADFGLSRETSDGDDRNYYRMKTNRPLPLRWTAPEVVTKLSYSVRSDVYAFGVFVFEVYSFGAFPFAQIKNDQSFLALLGGTGGGEVAPSLAGNLPSSSVSNAPAVVHALLEECLLRESKDRPSFEEIVNRTKPIGTTTAPASGSDLALDYLEVVGSPPNIAAIDTCIEEGSDATSLQAASLGVGLTVRLNSDPDPGYLEVGSTNETNERAVEPTKKTGPKRKPSVYLGFDEESEGATEMSEL
jgi:serine/threonine protein kinase